MINLRPFEIKDFSGGVTDNHVDADPRKAARLDNLSITNNRKLLTRDGSKLDLQYDSALTESQINTNARVPNSERIGTLINHANGTRLLVHAKEKLYYRNTVAFSTLQGPVSSNDIFPANTTSNILSHASWNDHSFVVSDSFQSPKKIYDDSGGTLRLRNAGLPSFDLVGAIELANALKATFNAHVADFGGSGEEHTGDSGDTITAANASNLETLITLLAAMETAYAAHEADSTEASPTYHQAQGTASVLDSAYSSPTSLTNILAFLDDFKTKYNAHDADTTSHTDGSTHQESEVRTPAINVNSGTGSSYIYALVYKFSYTVGSVRYIDYGPTTLIEVADAGAPQTNNIDFSAIPSLINGSTESYDTATIELEFYRTENGGQTFYLVGSVTNGTATFSDAVSDATLIDNTLLYTDGGVLDNDPPPPSKFVHIVDRTAYYAHVKENSEVNKFKIRQSVQDDPDSCPSALFDLVEDEITGISSVRSRPIVLCKRHIYRLDGTFDELGRGGITHTRISDTAGCISSQSIVQTESALFWFGNDGVYSSDGYNVKKISDHLNETYANFKDNISDTDLIVGAFDEKNGFIFWTTQTDSSNSDNDSFFVLDLRWGLSMESTFSTWSGGDSFSPSSILYYNNFLYRADNRGYIFKHSPDEKTDRKVDLTINPAAWEKKAIIWDYKTVTTNFDGTFVRKWVPKVLVTCGNKSNVTVQINSFNDDSTFQDSLKLVQFDKSLVWGDPFVVWGDETVVWGFSNSLEEWRRFPGSALRCSYKQLQLTNGFGILQNSDLSGTATVDALDKTITLDVSGNAWLIEPVDYVIAFDDDNYMREFTIVSRTSDTVLTVQDNQSALSDGSKKWVIKGYRKGGILNLLNLNIFWSPFTQSQDKFFASSLRENA